MNNVRIPATLLASAAVGSLFVGFDSPRGRSPLPRLIHTLLVTVALSLEFSAVFIATSTSVRLLAGHYNPMASDVVSMLRREFEVHYLGVRLHFFTGLISFMASLALRAWASLPRDIGLGPSLILVATCLHLVQQFNATVHYYAGFFHMWARFLYLYGMQMVTKKSAAGIASVAFAAAGLIAIVRTILFELARRSTAAAAADDSTISKQQ